jgi:hypothetical protein
MSSRYSQEILSVVLPTMTKANPSLLSSGTFYLAEIANKLVIGCGGWTKERPGNGEIIPGVGHISHFNYSSALTDTSDVRQTEY